MVILEYKGYKKLQKLEGLTLVRQKSHTGSVLGGCFSLGKDTLTDETWDEVWKLFSAMAENPDKPLDEATDILKSALQGNLKGVQFENAQDIYRYASRIKRNKYLSKNSQKNVKRKLYIDHMHESEDNTPAYGTILESAVVAQTISRTKDAFEDIADNSELRYAVETIKDLRQEFFIEAGVDLVKLLKQALRGIPDAVLELKRVCTEYELVGEQIKVILSSGEDINTCFA